MNHSLFPRFFLYFYHLPLAQQLLAIQLIDSVVGIAVIFKFLFTRKYNL